jgi:membrane-bound lytic murein transglycosylase MltF
MITDKYDDIIKDAADDHFPELCHAVGVNGWLLIKAQIWQESSFDPDAVSPVGAQGLMQIMPKTAKYLNLRHSFEPEANICAGVRYLAEQYAKLAEIPHTTDRLSAALASYNCGRGYVNAALALGRKLDGLPESYADWQKHGEARGTWQVWEVTERLLETSEHNGKTADIDQVTEYVLFIWNYFAKLVDRKRYIS